MVAVSQLGSDCLEGSPIQELTFKAFCQVLGINPDDVAHYLREDWGSAPDVQGLTIAQKTH